MTARTDSSSSFAPLSLAYGLQFEDLYDTEGLARVDARFLTALEAADPDLKARLSAARAAPDSLAALQEAELLIAVAAVLDRLRRRSSSASSTRSIAWWTRTRRASRSSA